MARQKPLTQRHASKDPYTLFDITAEIKEMIAEITEAQEERDYDLIEQLTEQLIEVMDLHGRKYESYVHVIKESIAAAKNNKTIADQFAAKATAHNNLVKRLKTRLHDDMKQHSLKTLDAGIFIVRTQKNSLPTLTVNVDADVLPERFQVIEPNKEELRHALSIGEEIDGVKLEKGEHIRIVTKI